MPHSNFRLVVPCLLFCALVAALPAAHAMGPPDAKAKSKAGVRLSATAEHTDQADVEDGEGAVAVTTLGLKASWMFVSAGYEQRRFHWDDTDELPLGDNPFDTLHELSVGANYGGPLADWLDEGFSWFVGGGVSSGFEEEVDDSFSGSARLGLGYDWAEDWSFRLGGAFSASPVSQGFFPIAGLNYRKASQEGLSFALGLPATELRYRFDRAWMVKAALGRDGGTYRLADDSDVREAGYVRFSGFWSGLFLEYAPLEDLTLTAGAAYHFAREMSLYDEDGGDQDEYDIDPALSGVLKLSYGF